MSKTPDVKTGGKAVVEELVLSPREAGQTTEAAFQGSLEASPTFKCEPPSPKTRRQPLRPKKNKRTKKKKR